MNNILGLSILDSRETGDTSGDGAAARRRIKAL
jgi:hypothetical protein